MGLSSPRKPFSNEYFMLEVIFPLESFKEYIKVVDKLLIQETEKATVRFKENEKEIKENIENANQLGLEGELWNEFVYGIINEPAHQDYEIKNYYYSVYYSSIVMSLYSFFERKLFYFCRTLEKDNDIKIDDLNGNGILKLKKYINKVLKIDLKYIDHEWIEIEKFNQLRNFIAHNDQPVLDKKKDTERIRKIKDIKGITLVDEGDNLRLNFSDSNFLNDLIGLINKILDEVYNQRAVHL